MYKHAIIIHMSYISGKRIAFHMIFEDSSKVKDINIDLTKQFRHLRFGFHVIQTHSRSIESVSEKDSFFDGIEYYTDYNQFTDAVSHDTKTHPTDIAKAVLSESSFTPLCLQNVTFFSHVEYLSQYGEELVEGEFEAWQHGPVIRELYYKLKPYKRNNVAVLDDYAKKVLHSRFLQIPRGQEIKNLIRNVSNQNSKLSTSVIYEKGHVKGGPWDLAVNGKISKKTIREYACNI